mmetsp:Transcript_28585/g.86348  ORF Transcript_28585/g.86348 Transcript_28585/m.86348 type:complete len:212 (+) Transcript_28585:318-953(+)
MLLRPLRVYGGGGCRNAALRVEGGACGAGHGAALRHWPHPIGLFPGPRAARAGLVALLAARPPPGRDGGARKRCGRRWLSHQRIRPQGLRASLRRRVRPPAHAAVHLCSQRQRLPSGERVSSSSSARGGHENEQSEEVRFVLFVGARGAFHELGRALPSPRSHWHGEVRWQPRSAREGLWVCFCGFHRSSLSPDGLPHVWRPYGMVRALER